MGINARQLCRIGLLAALICVIAPWTLPLTLIPVSLGSFAVYLVTVLCSRREACLAVLVYLLLGFCGLPVFAGGMGGIARLFSLTGGYLWGYWLCAWLGGSIIGRGRGDLLSYAAGLTAGTLLCYLLGTLWFMLLSRSSFIYALSVCVLPFCLVDMGKIIIASLLGYKLRTRFSGKDMGRIS